MVSKVSPSVNTGIQILPSVDVSIEKNEVLESLLSQLADKSATAAVSSSSKVIIACVFSKSPPLLCDHRVAVVPLKPSKPSIVFRGILSSRCPPSSVAFKTVSCSGDEHILSLFRIISKIGIK